MIGIDIVENHRLVRHLDNQRFLKRILSELEYQRYLEITNPNRRLSYLAGRFCAKEALVKALAPISFPSFNQVSILNDQFGSPYVVFNQPLPKCQISISHERNYTVAIAIRND